MASRFLLDKGGATTKNRATVNDAARLRRAILRGRMPAASRTSLTTPAQAGVVLVAVSWGARLACRPHPFPLVFPSLPEPTHVTC